MKRLISLLRPARSNESGAIMPILMLMASLMVISGVAFLGVSSYQSKNVTDAAAHMQAKYNAESAVRKALFRIENAPTGELVSWATFSDSGYSAIFDSANGTVIGTGWHGDVTDTIRASVNLNALGTQDLLGHIVVYKRDFSVGPDVVLTYAAANAPLQIKGWWRKWRMRHKLFDHSAYPLMSKHFLKSYVDKKGKTKYNNLLTKYNNNQVFDGTLGEGIHFIKGNVELRNGTVLNGSIFATGSITFSGTVSITASQLGDQSPIYPGYFPAIVAMRNTDEEQEEEDDTTDMSDGVVRIKKNDWKKHKGKHDDDEDNSDGGNVSNHVTINGMVFSRRSISFGNGFVINGMLMARNVYLSGNCQVTFDGRYHIPPPPETEIDEQRESTITAWNEKSF